MSTWCCPACTFENPFSAALCEICEALRPAAIFNNNIETPNVSAQRLSENPAHHSDCASAGDLCASSAEQSSLPCAPGSKWGSIIGRMEANKRSSLETSPPFFSQKSALPLSDNKIVVPAVFVVARSNGSTTRNGTFDARGSVDGVWGSSHFGIEGESNFQDDDFDDPHNRAVSSCFTPLAAGAVIGSVRLLTGKVYRPPLLAEEDPAALARLPAQQRARRRWQRAYAKVRSVQAFRRGQGRGAGAEAARFVEGQRLNARAELLASERVRTLNQESVAVLWKPTY